MTCVSMLLVCRAVTSRVQPPLSSQCGRHMSRGWGLVTLWCHEHDMSRGEERRRCEVPEGGSGTERWTLLPSGHSPHRTLCTGAVTHHCRAPADCLQQLGCQW